MTGAKLTGIQKAAALIIALGPELSAQVLKHVREEEIERLATEVANMERVSSDVQEAILEECYQLTLAQEYAMVGGVEYARELLSRTMGAQKANDVIQRLMASRRSSPFDFLRSGDASQLIGFIQNEHPQTIALILAHLDPKQAGAVLSALEPGLQAEVAMRIAVMDRTAPEVVREVERVLKKKLSLVLNQDYSASGGVDFLVKVLTQVDRGAEKTILEFLEESNPALAEEVRKMMFVFEDIILLDDRSIQRVLREVDTRDLALALKGTSDEVKERVFRNISSRAAELVRDEMEAMGPVRLRAVEEAQQKIVAIIRRLEEAEEIVISRGGKEDLVV